MSSEYLVRSGRRPVLKIEFIRSAVGKRSYRYPAILQPASNPLISLARVSGNRLSRAVLQAEYRRSASPAQTLAGTVKALC